MLPRYRSVRQEETYGPLLVTTKSGLRIQGKLLDDTRAWLGVPYAKPPIGNLRFRPPVKLDNHSSSVINATSQPNSCVQIYYSVTGDYVGSQMWNLNTPISEDCLYLNIHAPIRAASDKVFDPLSDHKALQHK